MLGELTTIDVPNRPLVIVPLGATEQHGPHLPLNTDTIIATAWADSVSANLRASGWNVVVAPALPYGASGEHQGFDGTMSVGNETLTEIVVQLGRSMRSWASAVVFLSGHAGNYQALETAQKTLATEGDLTVALVPRLQGSDAHAGHTETSMIQHLQPDLVHTERAEAGCTDPITKIMPSLVKGGVIAVSPNGVLGDPSGASAEIGIALFARLVDQAVSAITEAHDR